MKKLFISLIILCMVLFIPLNSNIALANSNTEQSDKIENINKLCDINQCKDVTAFIRPTPGVFGSYNPSYIYTYHRRSTDHLVEYSYFQELDEDNYGYNQLGTCISLSAAMLLGFYDDMYYNEVLYNNYEGDYNLGSNENLHQHIIQDIQPDALTGGTPNQVNPSIGVLNYLNDNKRKICFNNVSIVTAHNSDCTSLIYTNIAQNIPTLIWFYVGNSAHSAICYGSKILFNSGGNWIVFHGGWQENPGSFIVHESKVFCATYLENADNIHNHSLTYSYLFPNPKSGHKVTCENCGYSYNEGHSFVPFGSNRVRCVDCGYTTYINGSTPGITSFNNDDEFSEIPNFDN